MAENESTIESTARDPRTISYAQDSGLLIDDGDGNLMINKGTPLTVQAPKEDDGRAFSGNDWKPNPNRYANRDSEGEAERRQKIRSRTTISGPVKLRDRDFIPFKEGQTLREQDKKRVLAEAKKIFKARQAEIKDWDRAQAYVNSKTDKERNEASVGTKLWDCAMKIRQPRPDAITKKRAIQLARRALGE